MQRFRFRQTVCGNSKRVNQSYLIKLYLRFQLILFNRFLKLSNECYCGNSFPLSPTDESSCNLQCPGDTSKYCGGDKVNSVYCLNLPCDTQTQQRYIGKYDVSWFEPNGDALFFRLINYETYENYGDYQSKLSEIVLYCRDDFTVGMDITYSDGKFIDCSIDNSTQTRTIMIDFTNRKLTAFNDKLQFCSKNLIDESVDCFGCDRSSSNAIYSLDVYDLTLLETKAIYNNDLGFFCLSQFDISWLKGNSLKPNDFYMLNKKKFP